MTIDEMMETIDKMYAGPFYVIRGRKGTVREGLSYGFGFHEDYSDMIFLWRDREYLENSVMKTEIDNPELYEIHEVTDEEFKTIYRKARIIS